MALLALMGSGGFFAFKKIQEKKKEKEAAKPDPDADYVVTRRTTDIARNLMTRILNFLMRRIMNQYKVESF